MDKIRVGISACLLGEKVRYDGEHKRNAVVCDVLSEVFDYVPACAEVAAGLGVPREPIQLEGSVEHPRLMTVTTRRDLTERMHLTVTRMVAELESAHLCGFIFKTKSPSCALRRLKVFPTPDSAPVEQGTGMFARAFIERFPTLPVADEVQLQEAAFRAEFIRRVRAAR